MDETVSPTNVAPVRLLGELDFVFEMETDLPDGTVHLYAVALGVLSP